MKQVNPLGTGQAVSLAIKHIKDNDVVLVLYGDMPLIKKGSIFENMLIPKEVLIYCRRMMRQVLGLDEKKKSVMDQVQ